MPFDGIVTKSIVSELNKKIIGAKINKIFQPTPNEIILNLYKDGLNYSLNLCINPSTCRINLTTVQKKNPITAPNFCMLLRKYITSYKIISISTFDLERTVEIVLEGFNELNDLTHLKLYIEIMNRQSNIILTNENNIIIDSIRHFSTESYEIYPARHYTPQTNNKKSFINLKSFEEFTKIILPTNKTIKNTIFDNFIGLSKQLVNYIFDELSIQSDNYSLDDLKKFYDYLKNIINSIGTANISCIPYGSSDYVVSLKSSSKNFNEFIDSFYSQKESYELFTGSRNGLLKIILSNLKKSYKKLENINCKLKECSNMDIYRLYGELITSNLYRLHENAPYAIVENYYNNNLPIKIPLDKSISPHKNADRYFKKYNKLKNALEIATEQKKETEKELDYIQSIVFSLENAKYLEDIAEIYEEIQTNFPSKKTLKRTKTSNKKLNKNVKSITIYKTTIDGYTVFVGKNNIQNDYLTFKHADRNDIWFHAKDFHGSHVVLKTNGETEIDDSVIHKCALLALKNCKGKYSTNVPIDYTYIRYVKKMPKSKPGMVTYTNQKTIFVSYNEDSYYEIH